MFLRLASAVASGVRPTNRHIVGRAALGGPLGDGEVLALLGAGARGVTDALRSRPIQPAWRSCSSISLRVSASSSWTAAAAVLAARMTWSTALGGSSARLRLASPQPLLQCGPALLRLRAICSQNALSSVAAPSCASTDCRRPTASRCSVWCSASASDRRSSSARRSWPSSRGGQGDEGPGLEGGVLEGAVEPDRELPGDLEGGERPFVVALQAMGRGVAAAPDLVEELGDLARDQAAVTQPAQQVELGLGGGFVQADLGRDHLTKELRELAELDQRGVGVLREVPLCQQPQAQELVIVFPEVGEVAAKRLGRGHGWDCRVAASLASARPRTFRHGGSDRQLGFFRASCSGLAMALDSVESGRIIAQIRGRKARSEAKARDGAGPGPSLPGLDSSIPAGMTGPLPSLGAAAVHVGLGDPVGFRRSGIILGAGSRSYHPTTLPEIPMSWKEQLDKAIASIKEAADSEQARDMAAKAKATATVLARKVKEGAVGAADALVEANRDPSVLTVRFLNAELTVLSPSEGISITRPDAATLVVADGQGNGLVVNAATDPAYVVEMIGSVGRLSGNTFDLGPEDGINVVVTKF